MWLALLQLQILVPVVVARHQMVVLIMAALAVAGMLL